MRITCPKCREAWSLPLGGENFKERVTCPNCRESFVVQNKEAPADTPEPAETLHDKERIHEVQTIADPGQQGADEFDNDVTQMPPEAKGRGRRPKPRRSRSKRNRVAREMEHLIDKTLAGYEIREMLGAGGMGAVFRARQVSLDRDVAVKVLPERLARNAEALARFTREALSAGQLNHPNIVQVYDVISSGGYQFISMEYVQGLTLGQNVKANGVFSCQEAAGLILQAARALAYAHERNIVHRDIKPENLLLNENGTLKVADMGLAKSIHELDVVSKATSNGRASASDDDSDSGANPSGPSADITGTEKGLGTPAYMPPEQATKAARVDGRADQYALGCTLYYLCSGRPPFRAKRALEYIDKHRSERPEPLGQHAENIPDELQHILDCMLAKKPEERFSDMQALIDALEQFLEVHSEEGATADMRNRELEAMEKAQAEYAAASLAPLARWLKMVLGAGILLAAFLLAVLGQWTDTFLFLAFGCIAALTGFVLHGLTTRDYLFRHLRHLYLDRPLRIWLSQSVLICILFVVAMVLIPGLVFSLAGGLLAGALYELIVCRKLRHQRRIPVENTEKLLRRMRLRGISEEGLQDFVAQFGRRNWEPFFEDIFGYEALVSTYERLQSGEYAKRSALHRSLWRAKLINWLEKIERRRRIRKKEKTLRHAEERRLQSKGVDKTQAARQAQEQAVAFGRDLMAAQKRVAKKKKASGKKEKPKPRKIKKKKAVRESRLFNGLRRISMSSLGWRLFRMTVGSVMLIFGLLPYLDGAGEEALRWYYVLGNVKYPFLGGVAGLLVLVTSFSGQVMGPFLMLIGSFLTVTHMRFDAVTMQLSTFLNTTVLLYGGMTLLISGFILTVLGKNK